MRETMSKYIRKSERTSKTAEERALAVLQGVCDSSESTEADKQAAATKMLEFLQAREKATPLRSSLVERIKLHRAAAQQCKVLTKELEQARQRISELEVFERQFAQVNEETGRLAMALIAA